MTWCVMLYTRQHSNTAVEILTMTVCVHIALEITAFVFVLCTAVPDDMCFTFVSQVANTSYTFYYEPGNDTCCCSLRWTNLSPNFSMSSNVTYFLFVNLSGIPTQKVQNTTDIRIRLIKNTRVCATPSLDYTMTGVWNIHGDKGFHVQCRKNNSVIMKTTPQVPLTTVSPSTRDTEVTRSAEPAGTTNHNDRITSIAPLPSTSIGHTKEQKTTAHVLLTTESPSTTDSEESRSAESAGTTSLSDGKTSVVPMPSTSIGRTQVHVKNGSMTTISMNEEDGNDRQVLWFIIGSVAGGLIIVIGIIICVCVKRKRSQTKYRRHSPVSEGYRRQGTSVVMANNTLYAHEHSANPAYTCSLAIAQGPAGAVPESRAQEHDDDNELVMAENCLYSHEVGLNKDQGTAGETIVHSPDPNTSELYPKVNKTPREQ